MGCRVAPGERRPDQDGAGVVRPRSANHEGAWWIRKSGGDHYDEHLGRLRDWIAELIQRRAELASS